MKHTQKLNYFLRSLANAGQEKKCPYCSGKQFMLIGTKYLITSLLKCKSCGLLHRHPKDSKEFLKKFYQKDYQVDVQMMTDLPSDNQIEKLKSHNFSELRDYLPIIKALINKPDIRMVDYGCSWGYNVFKLKQDGVDVTGFELSVPRARFGEEKLGIIIATQEKDIRKDNDLIYSSHVIEHLYAIQDFITLSRQKLKDDGIFMAFCPNGSVEYRKRDPDTYKVTWGSLHPNYLDIEFASNMFKKNPYLLLTSDWPYNLEKLEKWDGRSQYIDEDRDGYELLIVAKPNVEI